METEDIMTKGASLFLAFILLFTFPIWIGIMAGGFGLIIGIFAAVFGIIAGVFGAIFGILGSILHAIFGGVFDWGWRDTHLFFPHVHFNGYAIAVIVIVLALVISKRRQRS